MKNNRQKLERFMIAAVLLIFVASIGAFKDAAKVHRKLFEIKQQTSEIAEETELAEFVSRFLPGTPETAEPAQFDVSNPQMDFVASKEGLKLTRDSCVPLTLDDITVYIPVRCIGENSLVSYQTQDHTACVGAYHMNLLTPPTIEIVGFLGGSCKAYHHAAYQAASCAVSHKKPQGWLFMSIQPKRLTNILVCIPSSFKCILRREFHLLRGSSLTRDVSRPPENYYF